MTDDTNKTAVPSWDTLIDKNNSSWFWRGKQLVHNNARDRPLEATDDGWKAKLRWILVKNVYATHNKSKVVRAILARMLKRLNASPDAWGLNLGAGFLSPHERLLNIDVMNAENVDIVTDGSIIPVRDDVLDLVIAQEVLEHIANFQITINEVNRILKPGGLFYSQTPFQIGKHHGPNDYWRFSRDALEHLFENDEWKLEEIGITLGHGSGFYRILVEFVAVTASIPFRQLYLPAKALAAFVFIPLRWLDGLTKYSSEQDRIAAGYYIVASKRAR